MPSAPAALTSILHEGGLNVRAAVHIRRELDRLRLAGLGSDDIAGAFLRYLTRRLATQAALHNATLQRLYGRPQTPDCPGQMLIGCQEEGNG